jgi:hypothetical protein
LQKLKVNPSPDIRIDWSVINPSKVQAINHDQLAGLQMADAVASSLFFALNLSQYGEVESRYFELLKSTVYRHDKTGALGYGLKFWPKSADLLREECPHVVVFAQ